MGNRQFNQLNFNEIVFENRNKSYGAFQLRENQDKTTMRALIICSIIGIFLFLFMNMFSNTDVPKNEIVEIIEEAKDIALPKETESIEEQKILPPARKVQASTQTYKEINLVPDHTETTVTPPTQIEVINNQALISTSTQQGLENGNNSENNSNQNNGTVEIIAPRVDIPDNTINTIYFSGAIEIKPEFPGGDQARVKFMMKNLKFTDMATENQKGGTAVIEFVIEKDGSISNIKLLKDPGYGLGQEAIRVIEKMPNWKPGMQNGNAVRCKYSYPIKFDLP
jgi:protein TonB